MTIKLMYKIWFSILVIFVVFFYITYVLAENELMYEVGKEYGLEDTIDLLEEYTDDLNLKDVTNDLLKGEALDVSNILDVILNLFFKELRIEFKTFVSILVVIILFSVIKCLELENGPIEKCVNLVMFLVITSIILKNYTESIVLFKNTINTLVKITEIVSPFVLTLLIATGEIVTSGIIGPGIMFLTSLCGVVISYVVLPLLNVTLVFKIISCISETINLEKLGAFFGKFAMWTTSIVFALVLAVLGLETTVSTSVDAVTVKTTQAAISNLIPVVGKFVSDSAELVMGATEVIGKTAGVIGIITIIVAIALPAIKFLLIGLIYGLLEGITEALIKENKTNKIIGAFSKQYTSLAGIMIGVGCTFVITIALAIKLIGKAVT